MEEAGELSRGATDAKEVHGRQDASKPMPEIPCGTAGACTHCTGEADRALHSPGCVPTS